MVIGQLTGKVALVIGGSRGIGLAVAQRFVREGARTFVTAREATRLQQQLDRLPGTATAIPADAGDSAQIAAAVAAIGEQTGRLDVLVVNAGISEPSRIEEITGDHFDRLIGLNVRALLFSVQAALPLMGRGAAIVLVGSVAAVLGNESYGVYGASKAAVRSFARTWTKELAPQGIRVNVVSPGPVDTAMMANTPAHLRDAIIGSIPMGRIGAADEVAAAVLFLAGDDSSYVAGAELHVDGGLVQV